MCFADDLILVIKASSPRVALLKAILRIFVMLRDKRLICKNLKFSFQTM